MKKLVKTLLVLCVTCCLSFCACGAEKTEEQESSVNKQNNEPDTEIKEPLTGTITSWSEAEKYIDIDLDTTAGTYISYLSDTNCEFYIICEMTNKSTDKVLSEITVNINMENETTGDILESSEIVVETLAPGETGIGAARFNCTRDAIKQSDVTTNHFVSMNYYSTDIFEGFKQSDLTISDVSTSGYNAYVKITNNSSSELQYGGTVKVAGKKDGKYAAYCFAPLLSSADFAPGKEYTFEMPISKLFPTDCDEYVVFVDYCELH